LYPIIYNDSGNQLAVLNNIIKESSKIKKGLNSEFIFEFNAYEKVLKSEYFDPANIILVDDQKFDIKYIQQQHQDYEVIYNIQCEHVNYRLADGISNTLAKYSFIGTPTQIMDDVLIGTEFISGVVDFTDQITLTINKEITRRGVIYELANALGGEIDFSDNGFTINIRNTIGANNGFVVRFGKNLKGVSKIVDSRGELKTSYTVDVLELKNSNDYIAKGYGSLEIIELGDTVRIIDEIIGLDVTNKIVYVEYDPVFRMNTTLEIATKVELLSDSIKKIDNEKLTIEGVYNGVQIGPNEGFVATRSDNKAKTIFNATEGISVYSDVGSGLVRNFYVDTNGNLIMRGNITVLGGSVPGTYITNDSISTNKIAANAITSDKISVSELSAISANLGTISAGRINAVNIYGANINIEDDVTIGQKLVLLDPNNEVSSTFASFKVLGQSGLLNTLIISGDVSVNNNTGGIISYTELDRIDAFVSKMFLYGSLITTEGINTTDLVTSRGIYGGGYVYCKTENDDNSVVIGLNSSYNYEAGMVLLYNGIEDNSEPRIQMYVDATNDKGVLDIRTGDYVSNLLSSNSGGGYLYLYKLSSTTPLAYLGPNSGENNTGYLALYNTNGTSQVDVYVNDGYGGVVGLSDNSGTGKVYIKGLSTGGEITMYNSGSSAGTLWFDGSNLRLTIGSTNYTITKT
jgi:hypothetical protein